MVEFNLDQKLANDTLEIADLKLCKLLLLNERKFPWLILVPKRNNLVEIFDLESEDYQVLHDEIKKIAKYFKSYFIADKVNIAALGNQVKQLHIHVIMRYEHDYCWPNPVWGNFKNEKYSTGAAKKLVSELREKLTNV